MARKFCKHYLRCQTILSDQNTKIPLTESDWILSLGAGNEKSFINKWPEKNMIKNMKIENMHEKWPENIHGKIMLF